MDSRLSNSSNSSQAFSSGMCRALVNNSNTSFSYSTSNQIQSILSQANKENDTKALRRLNILIDDILPTVRSIIMRKY